MLLLFAKIQISESGEFMKNLFLASFLIVGDLSYADQNPPSAVTISIDYTAKDYSHLLGMRGFANSLLKMHFELYQGYVKNINTLLDKLRNWPLQNKDSNYEYSALKRRVGWEFDGMRLHELYFENLGGTGKITDQNTSFYNQISKDFGSFEKWKQDFITTGLSRGIGWVILYYDSGHGRFINTWIEEHDLGHLAGCTPVLVMDVWEHAYITQYGLDRAKYIDAFFDNINWPVILNRYDKASKPLAS